MAANQSSVTLDAAAPEVQQDSVKPATYLFPCTIVQKTCWLLDQMSPGTAANNIAVRFVLSGPLQPSILEDALNEIVRRHEVMRTRFVARDGEPMQLVESELKLAVPVQSLLDVPPEKRAAEAERLAAEEALVGFNIEEGPLFRARLVQTGEEKFVLLVTMHHIISDGWSVGIVTGELGIIYESLAAGTASPLPPLPVQYADYACWQQQWIDSGELDGLLERYRQRVDGFTPLVLPTDFERPSTLSGHGEIRSLLLPRKLTDTLKTFSDRHGCTLFVTMLAGFAALMRYESSQTEIVLRTQTAGRDRVELESLIGWFVNSIILRMDLSGDPSFLTLVERVHKIVLEGFDFQDVPFERIMGTTHPAPGPSRQHPPFQVNFIFQRDLVSPWTRAGITLTPIPSKAAGSFVDLNFFLVERSDGWRASVDVNTDVFKTATGAALLAKFQALLEKIAADPSATLPELTQSLDPPLHLIHKDTAFKAFEAPYVAPRSALEQELVEMWEELLGTGPIGIQTNFCDLGGHSLLAAQMLSKIQERFGKQVTLAGLLAEPTIAAISSALRNDFIPTAHSNIIPVQPSGAPPALFMVGGDHWFRPLARHLGSNQPLLGLSLQRYENRGYPTSFAEIADDLAGVILGIQKSGPFLLSGWCVDGTIAFEVARTLESRGHTVGLVALLDAINPEYRRELESPAQAIKRALGRTSLIAHEVKNRNFSGAAGQGWTVVRNVGTKVARTLSPYQDDPEADAAILQVDPDRQEFRKILYESERAYTPGPLMAPVLLIHSELAPHQAPDLGWKRVALSGLSTVKAEGDHIQMFRDPYVKNLAAVLGEHLAEAKTGKPQP